jgi:glutathione-regulated potassium-efflux system ancillary protein KefC
LMLVLFGLGALALWSGSEAVLPAYITGMVLAESAARDSHWVRWSRTLTAGFLTPLAQGLKLPGPDVQTPPD